LSSARWESRLDYLVYSGKPTRREMENSLKDAIIAAAKTVFLREGYQASIDSIIDEVGIARQTLYNHFKDKQALFKAVIETVAQTTMQRLRTLQLDEDVPLQIALHQFGAAYMQGMLDPENLAMTRLISSAVLEYPAAGKIAYEVGSARSIAALASYLAGQREAGHLHCAAPEMIAESFFGALVGPARFRYLLGVNVKTSPAQRRAYVREIVRLYVTGLQPSARKQATSAIRKPSKPKQGNAK
jgi:TetR/AcrR family transcriptional regulator, mexJK operon transcriptional repressor